MKVRVVITGRSYHTASEIPAQLDLPEGSSVAHAVDELEKLLADGAKFPASCLVAVSGQHLGTRANLPTRTLNDNDELMLVAPVAGG